MANPLILPHRWTPKHVALVEAEWCVFFSPGLHLKVKLNSYRCQNVGCVDNSKSCFLPYFSWLRTNVIFKWLTSCWCCLCNCKKLSILFQAKKKSILFLLLCQITLTLLHSSKSLNTFTFKTGANTVFDTIAFFFWVIRITSFSTDQKGTHSYLKCKLCTCKHAYAYTYTFYI